MGSLILALLLFFGVLGVGRRYSGPGLGLWAILALWVLLLATDVPLGQLPLKVIWIIFSVIIAASAMEATGGVAFLLALSARALRARPWGVFFIAPLLSFGLAWLSGTGHTLYVLLPIIVQACLRHGLSPEGPLAGAVVGSQLGVGASPVSAVSMLMRQLLARDGMTSFGTVLSVTTLAALAGVAAIGIVTWYGFPRFAPRSDDLSQEIATGDPAEASFTSVAIFIMAVLGVVVQPYLPQRFSTLDPEIWLSLLMFAAAALMFNLAQSGPARTTMHRLLRSSLFPAGMNSVVVLAGMVLLGQAVFDLVGRVVRLDSWMQGATLPLVLAGASIFLFSQSATLASVGALATVLPGFHAVELLANSPALSAYLLLANYPTMLAARDVDPSGSVRLGYIFFGHSFLLPAVAGIGTTWVVCQLLVRAQLAVP